MSTVLVARHGALGRLTLNRPEALNALDIAMVRAIDAALSRWEDDPRIAVVLLDGVGERAFCAGGDFRALHDFYKAGDWDAPARFFAEEYRLNGRLARYPKPVVAVMHGVTMGGGIGLGGHVRHRLVTSGSRLAMPEVGIGFFPDVGGTHLLGTAPGELGTYAALTGAILEPSDAIACGLADAFIAPAMLARLQDRLAACRSDADVAAAVAALANSAAPGVLQASRGWIDRCFSSQSVETILAALNAAPEPEAQRTGALIASKCPTSLVVTFLALRAARTLQSLDRCLEQDLRISLRITRRADFVEGVRAAVVDKDRLPRWRPGRLRDVDPAEVEAQFAPFDADDLARTTAGLDTHPQINPPDRDLP